MYYVFVYITVFALETVASSILHRVLCNKNKIYGEFTI